MKLDVGRTSADDTAVNDIGSSRARLMILVCACLLAPGVALMGLALAPKAIVVIALAYTSALLGLMGFTVRWVKGLDESTARLSEEAERLRASLARRKTLEQELRYLAFHDHLTGLANRALFNEELSGAMARSRRNGHPLAILMIDVDDFKLINDGMGHGPGDDVLAEIARRAKSCLRESDIAARLGGDELVLIMENVDDEEPAVVVAERLSQAMREPIEISGARVLVGASIGIALSDEECDRDELLRRADLAMYEAKVRNRGGHVVWDPSIRPPGAPRVERTLRIDV